MQPLGERAIIALIDSKQTESGLILSTASAKNIQQAKVVALPIDDASGLIVDDVVIIKTIDTTPLADSEDLLIIDIPDILAKLI